MATPTSSAWPSGCSCRGARSSAGSSSAAPASASCSTTRASRALQLLADAELDIHECARSAIAIRPASRARPPLERADANRAAAANG
jgi:hypothetical protein